MRDLISRKKVCDWLNTMENDGRPEDAHGYHNACAYVSQMPSAQQWIPCSERLPEMYDEKLLGNYDNSNAVIITYEYHGKLYVSECCIVYCSDGKWRYLNESGSHEMDDDARVIAWMPLPSPYKEISDE